jgi:uncharacterized cupin superfamily protein
MRQEVFVERKKAGVLRASDINREARTYRQRLNPRSRLRGTSLGRLGGLERTGVTHARLAPGEESFAYHSHLVEEEWLYVISGRAVALIDGVNVELGPADFVGFPAPSVPHLLRNPYDEELVYLMGGENRRLDVLEYPEIGKSYLLVAGPGSTAFHEMAAPIHPFGRDDD